MSRHGACSSDQRRAMRTLAQFPGFAELKRSLREAPQLRILGHVPEIPLQAFT
jgi:hypothetical protein